MSLVSFFDSKSILIREGTPEVLYTHTPPVAAEPSDDVTDVDEETFGDSATDADATVGLPDFFTTKGTAGDQEFTK